MLYWRFNPPQRFSLKIIHRYILLETLPLFGLCLTAFTFLFMMNKMFSWLDLILNKGVPFWEALLLYLNTIPLFMVLTVPMAVLVAVLLSLGRLGSDLEVTALKSNGIHVGHLVGPLLLFGLAATLFMVFFNNSILPASNFSLKKRYFHIVQQKANVAIKERVFIDAFAGYQFYIDSQTSDGTLQDVKIFSRPNAQSTLWTTVAKRGRIVTDPKTFEVTLRLYDGFQSFLSPKQPEIYNRMYFKSQVLNLGLENQLGQMSEVQKDYNEMNLLELRTALHQCAPADTGRKLLLRSEFQKRLSLPFACLAVTWFAAPLGLLFRRRGFIAFTFGILMIFAYYLIFIICEVSSLKGLLLPEAGLWVANIVFLALGWLLYRLAVHERQAFVFFKKKKPGETP